MAGGRPSSSSSSVLLLLFSILVLTCDVVWSGITEYSSRSEGTWDVDAYNANDNTIMAQNIIVLKKRNIPDGSELDSEMEEAERVAKFGGLKMGKCIVYCMTDVNCKSVAFDDFAGSKPSVCVRSTATWKNSTIAATFITDTDTDTIVTYALDDHLN